MADYADFLAGKRREWSGAGLSVEIDALPVGLYPFQARLATWALRKGRAALFADTGLGKTRMQVAWAAQTPGRALILAPLCVAPQTIAEAARIGVEVTPLFGDGRIEITNYERLHHVDPSRYTAIVLDESSILKAFDGKTKTRLIAAFRETPFKLCCTATPAPNDIAELANHCEFLGIMTRAEMLATFFVHVENDGAGPGMRGWRLKGHAHEAFYRWLASWGMFLRRPSDLGFSDDGYVLPPLTIHDDVVGEDGPSGEYLFSGMGLGGIRGRLDARRRSLKDRVAAAVTLVSGDAEQWIIWCGLNEEQESVARDLGETCVSIAGSDEPDVKQRRLDAFLSGAARILVTKPRIAGFGLNLQRCHRAVFVGLGDSYEAYYQAIRRCWRFGQEHPVDVHIIVSPAETEIVANVRRKEAEAIILAETLIGHMADAEQEEIGMTTRQRATITRDMAKGEGWRLHLGDCVDVLREQQDASVDLSVYSPPFIALYTYTNSERDIGNCSTRQEFLAHFAFVARELLRVTKPGRLTCCHVSQVTAQKARDGFIGLHDLRGPMIECFSDVGWIYHGDIAVDKDPQALRDGTPVLTPRGWRAIETVKVGDEVIGGDGRVTKVIGVWPQGERQMYRVTTSDGASIECDAAHRWTVRPMGRKWSSEHEHQWVTRRTDDLRGHLYSPRGIARYELPMLSEPASFAPSDPLPIDPYVLGVLLGDGCLLGRTVAFIAEPDIIARVAERVGGGCEVVRRSYGARRGVESCAITHPSWHVNPVLSALRRLGLEGQRAWEKHIPSLYKFAAPEDRLELLRGLMDTDGTCKRNGMPYFSTVSERLAADIVALSQGLGGLATVRIEEQPAYHYRGATRYGRTRYIVAISMPATLNPFSLPRKAARWHRVRSNARRIVAIDATLPAPCTCITVSAENGLYVTAHGLVTHNSQAIRTKSKALLFVQLRKDASWLRPALADYILVFRAPGENAEPIHPDLTNEDWIAWARPIWYNIRESDVLNVRNGRGDDDDRHICPLQLGVIERCIRLWSNPGDVVADPFAGIGSTGYEALRLGRRFVGAELKREYWLAAARNLRLMEESTTRQAQLFETKGEA